MVRSGRLSFTVGKMAFFFCVFSDYFGFPDLCKDNSNASHPFLV